MKLRGGSFGLVILVVVMAVVLVLVAQAWERMAPHAVQVSGQPPVSDHGQPEAREALRSGQTPDLQQTRRETDAHSADVNEALAAIE